MATIERRIYQLEQASQETDYSRKLSVLVPDTATDAEIEQTRRKYRTDVHRFSADPFATSFLG